jgi:putative ABC transport system substrate-binding protein
MRRRDFIGLLGSAATCPIVANAQAKPVIGFLGADKFADYANEVAAFRQGLEATGAVVGQNVTIEFRWAEGQDEHLGLLADDLMSYYANVLFCDGVAAVLAAKKVAGDMPIVFTSSVDPVSSGIVASLQPQGNVTGVSYASGTLGGVRLELLHELLPKASTIAVLRNPDSRSGEAEVADLQSAAIKLKLTLDLLVASSADDTERAFAAFDQHRPDGLIVLTDMLFMSQRSRLAELATHYRIPAIYDQEIFTRAGGLMSYGASPRTAYREAGKYVGQILKGAVPADLPILLPIKFDLLVNVRAASSIGLTIPDSFLIRADDLIK